MDLASLEIVLAIIAQTVVIGFYIGTIKTVVDRLVKDVENIRQDLKEGLKDFYKDLVELKASIEKVEKKQISYEGKIDNINGRVLILENKHNN